MKFRALVLVVSLAVLTTAGCSKNEDKSENGSSAPPAESESDAPPAESGSAAPPAAESEASSPWGTYLSPFLDEYFALNPAFAVYQGRHEFDGRLPDWSEEGLKKQIDLRKTAIAGARAIDASKLSDAERFERDYLISVMDGELFWLEEADRPHRNPDFYVGKLDPNVYVARPYADAETRMKAFIQYANNIPAAVSQIKSDLKLPLPETYLKYGQAAFNGFAEYYTGDAKTAFAGVTDAELQKQFDAAAAAAAAAMKDLAAHIGSVPPTTDGYALGADKFADMLWRTERVKVPLDQLEAIARVDLKRNQDALKEACGTFAPGQSLALCMDKMNADKPANGPVQEAREQLPALRAFIMEKNLVSIPGTEQALVEEAPPYNRQNFAYIDIPGPYETGLPSVYYIAPPDPSWDAETRANYVPGKMVLMATSIHEVWPGHFLNFLHANRAKSAFGKIFVGYAFAEGWAHYTEEMMMEAGLDDGKPEMHVGQLSDALLRNCRFLSAIGLHAKGMSVQESFDLFRNECYQDKGNAEQQAARGTYDPAYLNYTMGKLMIRRLRKDWTAKHFPDGGERAGWKEFHDTFLSYGGPPIPMVRRAMMEEAEPKAVF